MPKKNNKKKNEKKISHRMVVARKVAIKKVEPSRAGQEKVLREQLLGLLDGGEAHATFDRAMGDWPVQLAGAKVANFPHTAWMLLEHMRIAQWDILEFSRNPRHVSPKWPEGYWPESEAPENEKAWKDAIAQFKKDMQTMKKLVGNAKSNLYAKFPWGNGQMLLREAMLLADHNAYHLGQLVMLRKCMGI